MEDLHKIWKHRWVNPKAKVCNSPVHNLGTFAIEPISKGEVVVILGGIIVPSIEIDKYREMIGGDLGINVDKDFWICPASRDELKETGVFNHSCNPNTGPSGNQIKLIAIRDIKADEEILIDYNSLEYNFKPFKCNCKSKNCKIFIEPKCFQ